MRCSFGRENLGMELFGVKCGSDGIWVSENCFDQILGGIH